MMIFLCLYLTDKIEHNFVMVGHSFGSAERDFTLIEQRWKVTNNNQVLEHVATAVKEGSPSRPFKTFHMGKKIL
ncbi:hypothetical protein ANN_27756 [Periplaneta americana]|uniref:Uncharacterized protein n=1 Tax=Periplaneta americana TaxID=6978 RepID=A0ABQ8RV26_PERAM|nr:hypothetical protein ANN_27756 [Periplaneta americana]